MYEIHELANVVAMASEKEQIALMLDIKKNGQREPAVLWNGEIVDGRCRQLACSTLGIPLKVKELSGDLSFEQVRLTVKSLNTRRNLTLTQKIVSAYKQQLSTGETNAEVVKQWAISDRSLKNFKYVAKHRADYVEPLFDGKSIIIRDAEKGFDVTTNKVNTIARIVKKAEEYNKVRVDESETVEFTVDGSIKTEQGKHEYYRLVSTYGVNDVELRKVLLEYVNYKYQLTE